MTRDDEPPSSSHIHLDRSPLAGYKGAGVAAAAAVAELGTEDANPALRRARNDYEKMGTFRRADDGDFASSRPSSDRARTIRRLSDRLLLLQRPLRVLDAVRWDDGVEHAFFAAGACRLPPVTRDYYASRPLPFNADRQRLAFLQLERDVRRRRGANDPAARLLLCRCEQSRQVIDLLCQRGTRAFSAISQRLYGRSSQSVDGARALINVARTSEGDAEEPSLDAAEAARQLAARLTAHFGDGVRVRVCTDLSAAAAAGSVTVKVRGDARFTPREVRLLEVHEGWVHLGTTLNGHTQPVCTFLSRPSTTSTETQEGLAVLTEVLALVTHPARARRLAQRVEGIAMAEAGADFLDVYRFYLHQGYPPRDSYQQAMRVFRGSLPARCGPFTKDLCYSRGFVQVARFLRESLGDLARRVSLLFCGKTGLDEMTDLERLADEGLLTPPLHVPPPFADLQTLSARLAIAGAVRAG